MFYYVLNPRLFFRLISSPPNCNGRDRLIPFLAILTCLLEFLLDSPPEGQLTNPLCFTTGETDVNSASLGMGKYAQDTVS